MNKTKLKFGKAEKKAFGIEKEKELLDRGNPEEIRDRYRNIPPIEEIQRHIVAENNLVALSVISERWDLIPNVAKMLIRKGTPEARKVYMQNRRYIKSLEPEFVKSAPLPEVDAYFELYSAHMSKKAYNICVDVRKIV